jgi:diketogulonate reductase-like aldo/keto reductase
MKKLKARGLIRAWGVSNFDRGWMEKLAAVENGTHAATDQVLYHLGSRGVEYDLLPYL